MPLMMLCAVCGNPITRAKEAYGPPGEEVCTSCWCADPQPLRDAFHARQRRIRTLHLQLVECRAQVREAKAALTRAQSALSRVQYELCALGAGCAEEMG